MVEIGRSAGLSPPSRVALGAWIGTTVALVIIVAFTVLTDSYVDSLPHRDTDMFGRPEGWFFLFVMLLVAPPLFVISGVIGFVAARSRYPRDRARGSVWIYIAAYLVGSYISAAVTARVGGVALVLIGLSGASLAAGYLSQWRAERRFDQAIAQAQHG